MTSVFILKSLIFSQLLLLVSADDVKCPRSFDCGYLGQIEFPFTTTQLPHCGLLAIRGCEDQYPYPPKTVQLRNSTSTRFQVLRVQPRTISIRDDDQHKYLRTRSCEAFTNNFTLMPHTSPLASFYIKYSITLFRCSHSLNLTLPKHFYKYSNCSDQFNIYYGHPNIGNPPGFNRPSSLAPCSTTQLAIDDANTTNDPFLFLSDTTVIEIQLSNDCEKCLSHGRGHCQLDSRGKFYCAKPSRSWVAKMVLGFGLAITVAVLLVIVKIYYRRWNKNNPTNLQIEVFLERHGPLQTKRYTYSEIKKVTNSFKNKLGQGGFGSVYKGQLHDGHYVAVKVLNEMKDEGEDFINEVASIGRTSHVHIVSLLGFCLEGSKRALVYEFMSNGSLEKFIFEENGQMTDCQLDFQMLYHIAIGVARGLEYLHKGCNTRILHFDIKPHNILLDENFNPKISDFGLAKICTRKESAVSIFGARGTAGYIAPEVFSRNFGVVSHKSDVYSYGMMVLEMVGRRKNIKVDVDRSSEIYFPHWIYNQIESNQELGMRNIRNECDDEKVRKMTIVGLWCIQTDPSTRPAMSKVVEMLEGRVELLQMPPKPYLYSPSTSPVHLSHETL